MTLVPEEEFNSLVRFREQQQQQSINEPKPDSTLKHFYPSPTESKMALNAVQHAGFNTESLLDHFSQGGGMKRKADQIIQKIKELYDKENLDWNLHNRTLTIEGLLIENVDFVKIIKRLITPLPQNEIPGLLNLLDFFCQY